ncbi:glycosyltransferase family 4 protein [Fredinandcohnia humi]
MKKVLIYYPFQLAKNVNSGSKLRPHEMVKAFREWGKQNNIDILLISGTSDERASQFKKLVSEGALSDLLFCYMENQTIPLWLTDPGHKPKDPFVDRRVLRYLQQHNVPVGVFYRDVYWKFDELYKLTGMKKKIMQTLYKMEEKFYEKYMHTVFLPSLEMGKYVAIDRPMTDLPPGGKKGVEPKRDTSSPLKGIYVGGINSEDYGLYLLLDAVELVNKDSKKCELTVVCREDEFASLPEAKKQRIQELQIRVEHKSGAELDKLYQEMDIAFIPRYRSEYNDFSVPVKLVEYLSAGLPIVATDCTAQKRFIETDGYGVICQDEKQSMANAIERMIESRQDYMENIQQTFMIHHSWIARVEKVKESLVGKE